MKTVFTAFALLVCAAIASTAGAQEVLPFPPTPSASTAGLTMQDSIYKKRVDAKHLPSDAPNILIILMDDVGPGQASTARKRESIRISPISNTGTAMNNRAWTR
jgi:hypothetical protein